MLKELITLIVIPILVGLVVELVSMLVARLLDEKDDD
ncbi:type I toxin-antitoxin system Fst family toxin [Pseudolactococcus yaeyamensis]